MEEWCYDNPDIDDFDRVDHKYYEFLKSATKDPIKVEYDITLIQVQNTSVNLTPFLLVGKDLSNKGLRIEYVEKKDLSNQYEIVIHFNSVRSIPPTLQLHALWEEEAGWSDIVDSSQGYTKIAYNKISFSFKHLTSSFNGYFILMDPGYEMAEFVEDFVPDYDSKEIDLATLIQRLLLSKEQEKATELTVDTQYSTTTKVSVSDEENDVTFNWLKLGLYLIVIFVFLFQFFGTGLIRSCKREREMDQLTLGGSKSEYNESVLAYNKSLERIQKLTNNRIDKFKEILIFTNDSNIKEVVAEPKMNYEVFADCEIGRTPLYRNNEIAKELNDFCDNVDSVGFNIFVKSSVSNFKIAELVEKPGESEFIVLSFYHYSEEEKEVIKKQIINDNTTYRAIIGKSKAEQIKELDEIQSSKVILSENELQKKKIGSGLRTLFAPRKGSIDTSQKFYFAVYNTQLSNEEFQSKVKLFVDMFLADKKMKGCSVQCVKLRSAI